MASPEDRLAELLKPDSLNALLKLVNIVKRADELGLLDLLNDALSDEALLRELANRVVTADNVSLLLNLGNLARLASRISEPSTLEAASRLTSVLSSLGKLGILDTIQHLLEEPEVIGELAKVLLNTGTIYGLMGLGKILEYLSRIRIDEALEEGIKASSEAGPISIVGILKDALKDEDFKRGLLFLIGFIRSIGAQLRR